MLVCDWELEAPDHRGRLEQLCGDDPLPRIEYLHCTRTMAVEADRIATEVRRHAIDYLVCDSVAFACDGPAIDQDVATRYMQCVRRFGVGSFHIAHVTKGGDESDQKPFGSGFWHNAARSTWNVKLAEPDAGNGLTLGLFNRKCNLAKRQAPIGLHISFASSPIGIRSVDLATVAEFSEQLPIWKRIRQELQGGPQSVSDLAEALEKPRNSIEVAVNRAGDVFTKIKNSDGRSNLIALADWKREH